MFRIINFQDMRRPCLSRVEVSSSGNEYGSIKSLAFQQILPFSHSQIAQLLPKMKYLLFSLLALSPITAIQAAPEPRLGCFCTTNSVLDYPLMEVAGLICCISAGSFIGLSDCKISASKKDKYGECCAKFNKATPNCKIV